MPQDIQTTWEQYRKDVLGTPKFLRKGTKVLVQPIVPHKVTIKGNYGEREVYIVSSREHGLIYVSPLQLVSIVNAFNGKYESAVTVEL